MSEVPRSSSLTMRAWMCPGAEEGTLKLNPAASPGEGLFAYGYVLCLRVLM